MREPVGLYVSGLDNGLRELRKSIKKSKIGDQSIQRVLITDKPHSFTLYSRHHIVPPLVQANVVAYRIDLPVETQICFLVRTKDGLVDIDHILVFVRQRGLRIDFRTMRVRRYPIISSTGQMSFNNSFRRTHKGELPKQS